jgi:hypothetical protein
MAVGGDGTTTARSLGGRMSVLLGGSQVPVPPGQQVLVRPEGTVLPATAGARLSLVVETPQQGFVAAAPTVKVAGRVTPGAVVAAGNTWLKADPTGRFEGEATVESGDPVVVVAMDAGGATVRQRVRPTRDTTPPTVHLDQP